MCSRNVACSQLHIQESQVLDSAVKKKCSCLGDVESGISALYLKIKFYKQRLFQTISPFISVALRLSSEKIHNGQLEVRVLCKSQHRDVGSVGLYIS